MKDKIRELLSAVLWTAAAGLMVIGTLRDSAVTMHWALFVALTAGILTGWIMVDCATYRERVRVDGVVTEVVERLQQGSNVRRL